MLKIDKYTIYTNNARDVQVLVDCTLKYNMQIRGIFFNICRSIDDYTEEELRRVVSEARESGIMAELVGTEASYSKSPYRASNDVYYTCVMVTDTLNNTNSNINSKSKQGGNVMTNNLNDMLATMMSMKMMKSMMNDTNQDLGKLFLMQQLANGQPLQVTDLIKSKLIKQFNLDDCEEDMPIEKILLLQMLDSGTLDVQQLMSFKMIGSLFNDEADNGIQE